jgi:hypothetical protein
VALGQVLSEYFAFPCQFTLHRLVHTHDLSSGAVTIGQWPQYQVDSDSPQEGKKRKCSYGGTSGLARALLSEMFTVPHILLFDRFLCDSNVDAGGYHGRWLLVCILCDMW